MDIKERIWVKNYPKGIPADIEPNPFSSLIALLEETMQKNSSSPAFENMGKVLTYGEIDKLSSDFAAFLQNHTNLKKGDRIAIQMPNLLQFPVAMLGALRAGLIVVNTNPLYTPREMEHQFKDSGAKAIVILANFADHLEEIIGNTQIETVIVTEIGDMLGGLKKVLVNFVVKYFKKMVPSYKLPGHLKFSDVMGKGDSSKFTKPDISGEDVAFLQYTGGTTGISKGAQLSHNNMVTHTQQTAHWFAPWLEEDKQDIMMTPLPLYHIFALAVNALLMMHIGAKIILITNPRDMKSFIKELKKHPITMMTGVNTLYNGLLNQPEFKEVDFSTLKGAIGGGMAVQDAVAEKWEKLTGSPLVEGYGLSETSPVLACNPLDGTQKRGTIGLPTPSTELRIYNEDGKVLPQGETGEICARGPQVMKGYWEKDNASVFFEGGWFRTGDIGMMNEDGFFKIVDRKKDMINVSGFKVFPNDIENTVASHDKVLEVGAVGVPDEHSTEAVKIFVVKKDNSLTEEELKEYCKKNMTGYKVPKYIEFRKELPKSNVGKIIRRHLREDENA